MSDLTDFLDAAEARAAAATPGAWHVTRDPLGTHVENGDGRGRIVFASGADRVDGNGEADAAFIAAARSDVPTLAGMVRAVVTACDDAVRASPLRSIGHIGAGGEAVLVRAIRAALHAEFPYCRVYWGSHGCGLDRGHPGHHVCTSCKEAEDYEPGHPGEVGDFPYYGPEYTNFWGEDAAGLPGHDDSDEERRVKWQAMVERAGTPWPMT
jgi:hypothetical protein